MIDFLVQNNDLVLGSGTEGEPFATTSAISQQVYITFQTWLGSWFYDKYFGIDYVNFNAGSQEQADLEIKQKLLSISGVTGIVSYTSSLDKTKRMYVFTATYTTTDSKNAQTITNGI